MLISNRNFESQFDKSHIVPVLFSDKKKIKILHLNTSENVFDSEICFFFQSVIRVSIFVFI